MIAPPASGRWTPQVKEDVVIAFALGASIDTLCRLLDLGRDELEGWIDAYARHGRDGLRAKWRWAA